MSDPKWQDSADKTDKTKTTADFVEFYHNDDYSCQGHKRNLQNLKMQFTGKIRPCVRRPRIKFKSYHQWTLQCRTFHLDFKYYLWKIWTQKCLFSKKKLLMVNYVPAS